MNMIRVKGEYKLTNIAFVATSLLTVVVGVVSAINKEVAEIACVLLVIAFLIIMIVDELKPMEVRFDKYWLMTKYLMFRKEIRMENITKVCYYIKKESISGEPCYNLILEISHTGRKLKLKELISPKDIENCKKGVGVMELFILYRFFEREYPKKAKGYWRFCGF